MIAWEWEKRYFDSYRLERVEVKRRSASEPKRTSASNELPVVPKSINPCHVMCGLSSSSHVVSFAITSALTYREHPRTVSLPKGSNPGSWRHIYWKRWPRRRCRYPWVSYICVVVGYTCGIWWNAGDPLDTPIYVWQKLGIFFAAERWPIYWNLELIWTSWNLEQLRTTLEQLWTTYIEQLRTVCSGTMISHQSPATSARTYGGRGTKIHSFPSNDIQIDATLANFEWFTWLEVYPKVGEYKNPQGLAF